MKNLFVSASAFVCLFMLGEGRYATASEQPLAYAFNMHGPVFQKDAKGRQSQISPVLGLKRIKGQKLPETHPIFWRQSLYCGLNGSLLLHWSDGHESRMDHTDGWCQVELNTIKNGKNRAGMVSDAAGVQVDQRITPATSLKWDTTPRMTQFPLELADATIGVDPKVERALQQAEQKRRIAEQKQQSQTQRRLEASLAAKPDLAGVMP